MDPCISWATARSFAASLREKLDDDLDEIVLMEDPYGASLSKLIERTVNADWIISTSPLVTPFMYSAGNAYGIPYLFYRTPVTSEDVRGVPAW
jgi:hypothetical protein